MTISEWLDKNGREEVCAELAKMATEIVKFPITCEIVDEYQITDYPGCFDVGFYFGFDDGSHYTAYLFFEYEDCTELTTTKILKRVASNSYDEYCEDPYADWNGKQRQFIDLLHDWKHQERPNWMW